jgi:DNA polymerase III psi subunit
MLPHLFQEELYHFTAPVAVVLPRPWVTYNKEEQLLLKKILTSVKVEIDAVQMVVLSSVDLNSLRLYAPVHFLIFGPDIREDIPMYQPTAAQGFMVVRADDLSSLDDQKKKILWTALRQMFGV